jgi:two-component system sensor histidine kinase ChiS
VDDYDGLREALAAALSLSGLNVMTASSGREALDILAEGFRPCVVLLDQQMPGMDGWAVWHRMQAHAEWSKTLVVMISARPVDRERVRNAGIREFLSKPVEPERIVATIEQHCERQPRASATGG